MPMCHNKNLLRVLRRGDTGTRATGDSGVSECAKVAAVWLEKGGAEPFLWLPKW